MPRGRDKLHPSLRLIAEESVGDGMGRSLKTAEIVAYDIVRDIVDRGLRLGDRLPHEAEMLAHYGVSRSSLREALRLLEVQGLVRPQPGLGVTVGEVAPRNLGRTMSLFFQMSQSSYEELLTAWTLTEPLVAQLAAANPDIGRKRELLSPFLADAPPRKLTDGLTFHDAVAELAENKVLAISYSAIGFIVSDHMLMSKERTQLEDFITSEHAEIATAIIAGDEPKSHELMAAHARHVVEDFRACWPAKLGERVRWR